MAELADVGDEGFGVKYGQCLALVDGIVSVSVRCAVKNGAWHTISCQTVKNALFGAILFMFMSVIAVYSIKSGSCTLRAAYFRIYFLNQPSALISIVLRYASTLA